MTGDKVLGKNRKQGVLLVGPYLFLRYKYGDKYACILRDECGKEFVVCHILCCSSV